VLAEPLSARVHSRPWKQVADTHFATAVFLLSTGPGVKKKGGSFDPPLEAFRRILLNRGAGNGCRASDRVTDYASLVGVEAALSG
jgi:hypothetical protein